MTLLVTAQTVFRGWKHRWMQCNKVSFMNLILTGLFTVQINWHVRQLKASSTNEKKNNILKSNSSWRCLFSLPLLSFCQFYCIFFFFSIYSKPTGEKKNRKTCKSHYVTPRGGFKKEDIWWELGAMPTFKLAHYRWETQILYNLNMPHVLH